MTPADAYKTLELPEGAPPADVDRAYETLYNDVQLRIQNAPTPKLRSRFEARLVEIETAYAQLRGNATTDADLPSIAPVETPADQGVGGAGRGRTSRSEEREQARAAAARQEEEKRKRQRKLAIGGAVAVLGALSVSAFFIFSGQRPVEGTASNPAADSAAVAVLLDEAKSYLAMDALDSPPGANAHESLVEIDRRQPGNPEARELRRELATKLFERASAQMDSSHWGNAAALYARMAAVAAEGSAEQRLAVARKSEAEQRRDETQQQIASRSEAARQQRDAAQQRAAAERAAAERQSAESRQALQSRFGSIHRAAQQGSIEGIEAFLSGGVSPNTPDDSGITALGHAVLAGNESAVRYLIQRGANVNGQNRRGITPLHTAATTGHEPIARLLLENGANVNARDLLGETPMRKAQENGREAIVRLLQRHGGL